MKISKTNQSGFGTYASDRLHGACGSSDDMHDGSPAFHSELTLHDESAGIYDDATGQTIEDINNPWAEQGVEISVVNDHDVLGGAIKKRGHSKSSISDQWMKENGHSWLQ